MEDRSQGILQVVGEHHLPSGEISLALASDDDAGVGIEKAILG